MICYWNNNTIITGLPVHFQWLPLKKNEGCNFFFQKIYQKNLKNHRYMNVLALVLE